MKAITVCLLNTDDSRKGSVTATGVGKCRTKSLFTSGDTSVKIYCSLKSVSQMIVRRTMNLFLELLIYFFGHTVVIFTEIFDFWFFYLWNFSQSKPTSTNTDYFRTDVCLWKSRNVSSVEAFQVNPKCEPTGSKAVVRISLRPLFRKESISLGANLFNVIRLPGGCPNKCKSGNFSSLAPKSCRRVGG